jgi:HK97 family phage major capsid protein
VARNHTVASARFPSTPRELAEVLADPAKASDMFGADPRAWEDFADHYATASPMVATLIAERAQLDLQATLQGGGGGRVPRGGGGPSAARGRNRIYNKHAPGAKLDDLFEGENALGRFLYTINPRNVFESAESMRAQIRNAGMSERVPSSGGFLVPELMRSGILVAALEQSMVRQRATVIPMDTLRVPIPSIDDTSHQTSVFGGVSAYWTQEGAMMEVSAPKFSRVMLEAVKLTLYTEVPNELLADAEAVGLTAWMARVLPTAVAFYEDTGFLTGSGVGEPEGIVNAPGAITVSRQASNQIILTDVIDMFVRLLPVASKGAMWACSPDAVGQLLQMALLVAGTDNSNPTTSPVSPPAWLMSMNAIEDVPQTLLGRPLEITEKTGPLGSKGDLMLVNWAYYLLGDRQQIQAAVSQDYRFQEDMTAFRWIERLDGRAWIRTPLTPESGGPTLSPYVILV